VHSQFLRHRHVSRWLAALILVTGWVVPLALPHYADDDPICVAAPSTDKADPGRVDKPGSVSQPDHCAVCHAARSFRSALHSAASGPVQRAAIGVVDLRIESPRRGPAFNRVPARAPPATHLPTIVA